MCIFYNQRKTILSEFVFKNLSSHPFCRGKIKKERGQRNGSNNKFNVIEEHIIGIYELCLGTLSPFLE